MHIIECNTKALPGFLGRWSQAMPCHGRVQTFQLRVNMLEDAQRFASWSTFAGMEPKMRGSCAHTVDKIGYQNKLYTILFIMETSRASLVGSSIFESDFALNTEF